MAKKTYRLRFTEDDLSSDAVKGCWKSGKSRSEGRKGSG